MPTPPTCENCRFYQSVIPGPWDPEGQCRRHAPGVLQIVVSLDKGRHPDTGWPLVDGRSWCGDHEVKA